MKNISLNLSQHVIEYFVHYEKQNQIIMGIHFCHCWLFRKTILVLPQSSDKIYILLCNTVMCSGPKYLHSGITQKLKNVQVCALVEENTDT